MKCDFLGIAFLFFPFSTIQLQSKSNSLRKHFRARMICPKQWQEWMCNRSGWWCDAINDLKGIRLSHITNVSCHKSSIRIVHFYHDSLGRMAFVSQLRLHQFWYILSCHWINLSRPWPIEYYDDETFENGARSLQFELAIIANWVNGASSYFSILPCVKILIYGNNRIECWRQRFLPGVTRPNSAFSSGVLAITFNSHKNVHSSSVNFGLFVCSCLLDRLQHTMPTSYFAALISHAIMS